MDISYPAFGEIVIDGQRYDHDVVVTGGQVGKRGKDPSKPLKSRFGHTPLSIEEEIPWEGPRLIVGTGYSGRLPVLSEIEEEAQRRGVELLVLPTSEAVEILADADRSQVNAVLHVTC